MADKYEGARENAQGWYDSIKEMVEELLKARGALDDAFDDAEHRIHESVIAIDVRSG